MAITLVKHEPKTNLKSYCIIKHDKIAQVLSQTEGVQIIFCANRQDATHTWNMLTLYLAQNNDYVCIQLINRGCAYDVRTGCDVLFPYVITQKSSQTTRSARSKVFTQLSDQRGSYPHSAHPS